jgi:hypothetical protein
MVNVGIFYDHLEYFMAIWYNLWPFGIVCGHWLNFSPIWNVWTKKNLATLYLDGYATETKHREKLTAKQLIRN